MLELVMARVARDLTAQQFAPPPRRGRRPARGGQAAARSRRA